MDYQIFLNLHQVKYSAVMEELLMRNIEDNFAYHGKTLVIDTLQSSYETSTHFRVSLIEPTDAIIEQALNLNACISAQIPSSACIFDPYLLVGFANHLAKIDHSCPGRVVSHFLEATMLDQANDLLVTFFVTRCSTDQISVLCALSKLSDGAFLLAIEHKLVVILGPVIFVNSISGFFSDPRMLTNLLEASLRNSFSLSEQMLSVIRQPQFLSVLETKTPVGLTLPYAVSLPINVAIKRPNGLFGFICPAYNNFFTASTILFGGVACFHFDAIKRALIPTRAQLIGYGLGKITGQTGVIIFKDFVKSFSRGLLEAFKLKFIKF